MAESAVLCACGGVAEFVGADLRCDTCDRPISGDGSLCRVCCSELEFGTCDCGGVLERHLALTSDLVRRLRGADTGLLVAATAYLGGDKSKASVARLTDALTKWVEARSES